MRAQTNGRTDGRTDRRYQVLYLPRFAVDNNCYSKCLLCFTIDSIIIDKTTTIEMDDINPIKQFWCTFGPKRVHRPLHVDNGMPIVHCRSLHCKYTADRCAASTLKIAALQVTALQVHCRSMHCKYTTGRCTANTLQIPALQMHCRSMHCKYATDPCTASALQVDALQVHYRSLHCKCTAGRCTASTLQIPALQAL